jgi:NAD(P)-dependent dehydrogenase (short-subunit alcohol dehydrogenase family)
LLAVEARAVDHASALRYAWSSNPSGHVVGSRLPVTAFEPGAIRALEPVHAFSLAGKAAVVTGAAGGIGRWLAAGLGAAGASVLLTDLDREGLEDAAELLAAADLEVSAFPCDLGDADASQRIIDATVERFGGVDVLVNNAALNRRVQIDEMDPETWDLITTIDLKVPYFLSQAAARVMRDRGGGSIVSISSINFTYGLEHISVYGPAKAGLSQLTRVMALEWTQHGIRANAIAPGYMDTPLAEPIWADPDISRWIFNRVPMKRRGQPSELVGMCQLLASDAGSFITGQTFIVDGGFMAGGRWFTPDR